MAITYLNFLINSIRKILFQRDDRAKMKFLLLITLCRLLNCDSINDISQTYGLDKNLLYESIDILPSEAYLRRIRRQGRKRLLSFLRTWRFRDPSFQSRHAITFCVDDFTRTARGELGGWAGLFYSGAEGGVVLGLNIEALIAVIGDGEEIIILDIRLVPPKPDGQGRPPMTKNYWLCKRLTVFDAWIKHHGANLKGLFLSVDAAYVSKDTVKLSKTIDLQMVSKLASNRLVSQEICDTFELEAPSGFMARLQVCTNQEKIHYLPGQTAVEYLRQEVWSPTFDQIVMITFMEDGKYATYFSINPGMKAITLANTIRRRWQLERLFWVLRQDLGVGDIHNQIEERVHVRLLFLVILSQAIRDCSAKYECSPKDIVRAIRRETILVPLALGVQCTFVPMLREEILSEMGKAA